ncbi:HNH endonuclease [Corynebacterium ulcerans]|uniref:HNH endonuclease n=1 Tax=Corynebacterium ulcerans TaxID=65058 RepID=UPI0018D985EF|nr:HNH endonuclease [Corynebacterium ulcerans]MBH5296526.1 HNH endonuclease [Corynebacterium ulcerans]MDK8888229.1 HNH endonuclease [Corynebacterium ulcerans]
MWSTDRKSRLPKNWLALRHRILTRDNYRCQLRYDGCKGFATDVDHIHRGDNHADSNLQSACSACHLKKTHAEALAARRLKKARRFRPTERHPGSR